MCDWIFFVWVICCALEGRNQRFLAKYVGHDMRCLSSFVQKHAKVRKIYISKFEMKKSEKMNGVLQKTSKLLFLIEKR